MTDNTDEAMNRARERLAQAWEERGHTGDAKRFLEGRFDTYASAQTLAAYIREVSAAIKSGEPREMAAFILPEPVDPDLLLAREAAKLGFCEPEYPDVMRGLWDKSREVKVALAAIKLARERGAVG